MHYREEEENTKNPKSTESTESTESTKSTTNQETCQKEPPWTCQESLEGPYSQQELSFSVLQYGVLVESYLDEVIHC